MKRQVIRQEIVAVMAVMAVMAVIRTDNYTGENIVAFLYGETIRV